MSPQASAILSLFELLPETDKEKVFRTLADRNVIDIKKEPRRSRIREQVMQAVRLINEATPNPKNLK